MVPTKLVSRVDPSTHYGGSCHIAIGFVGKSRWVGYNSSKTNPNYIRQLDGGGQAAYTHAELNLINQVPRGIRPKLTIYVARLRKDGSLAMSKPCKHCIRVLALSQITLTNIWYTDQAGSWVRYH